jgi:hypothetical protein
MHQTRDPDVRFIASALGGGWAIALTEAGFAGGESAFGQRAEKIPPVGAGRGWIVEPAEAEWILEALLREGLVLEAASGEILGPLM